MADDLGIGDLGCYGNHTLRYNVLLVVLVGSLRGRAHLAEDAFKICRVKVGNS